MIPGSPVNSIATPAAAYASTAIRTVTAPPSTVAMEEMPPSRSATMSCTAPNACDATPHRKNAARIAHSAGVNAPPASTMP